MLIISCVDSFNQSALCLKYQGAILHMCAIAVHFPAAYLVLYIPRVVPFMTISYVARPLDHQGNRHPPGVSSMCSIGNDACFGCGRRHLNACASMR